MWPPRSEADIAQAIADGLMVEGQHLDFKARIEQTQSANRDFAIDVASFAVDGGVIIIGIDEKQPGAPTLAPTDLTGLKERLQNIALTRVQEGVTLRPLEAWSDITPDRGYLVVEVPLSANAPHMVDGKYRGRAGPRNITLSHPDVVRLFERRKAAAVDLEAMLREEIAADLIPDPAMRLHGHLYAFARPLFAEREALLRVDGAGGEDWVRRLTGIASGLYSLRPNGWSIHHPQITGARLIKGDALRTEHQLFDMEVHESGAVRLWYGGSTLTVDNGEARVEKIQLQQILELIARVVVIASRIGGAIAYAGPWGLGVAANGLRAKTVVDDLLNVGWGYSADEYFEVAAVTAAEVGDTKKASRRVIGRLMRGLDRADLPIPVPVMHWPAGQPPWTP